MEKRSPTLFPNQLHALASLGENIQLARKRRGYTQTLMSIRTGLSRHTIRKIERGDPGVAIGHYISTLGVLGLANNVSDIARDDDLGRKLQDIKLLGRK